MKSINHNELDEMPKMKGGNSKRGKKEPTTEVVIKNSLKVIGEFTLVHEDGTEEEIDGRRSFCRCGLSDAMPYCDNTHRKNKLIEIPKKTFKELLTKRIWKKLRWKMFILSLFVLLFSLLVTEYGW